MLEFATGMMGCKRYKLTVVFISLPSSNAYYVAA